MKNLKTRKAPGVTLIELIVVLGIVSILSTIAVGIYTKELQRARIAKTRVEIRSLEVAINRYQIDVGQFPPSGSGTQLAPNALDNFGSAEGAGYMVVALRSSLNGQQLSPLSERWVGPYIDFDENRLGSISGGPISGLAAPAVQFLDAWGNPIIYINSDDYALKNGTELPSDSPFFGSETYYNASTFQLVSYGPNGRSNFSGNQLGTEPDDITNWEASGY